MTDIATQLTFDYSALSLSFQVELRASKERIKMRLRRTVEDIIEIGRELHSVKDRLPHGQFERWVESEFEMSKMTSARFMQAWERFGNKSNMVLLFSPAVLYSLAAPSTPDVVVDQAVAKADAGEVVNIAEVKRLRAAVAALDEHNTELRDALHVAQAKSAEVREVVKEIIPADYEKAKAEATALRKQLATAKAAQDKAIKDGIEAQIDFRKKEINDLEKKRDGAQRRVDEVVANLKKMGDVASRLEYQRKVRDRIRNELMQLSVDLAEHDHVDDQKNTSAWAALANDMNAGASAIRKVIGVEG